MAEVRRAAVIGTGTMGPGMGAVLARAGIETALHDVSAEALERAKAGVQMAAGVLARLEAPEADGGSIRFETELAAALDGADFVVEAVPEKLELKHEIFPQLEQHVGEDTILASNTSGIPITKIAEVCSRPERVIGMHWSNPPHLIPMIEVIPVRRPTSEWSTRHASWFAASATTRWSRKRCRASSRTASSTRSSANASTSSTAASSTLKGWISTFAGASATSWPSSARWSCSTWPVSTSTTLSARTSTRTSPRPARSRRRSASGSPRASSA